MLITLFWYAEATSFWKRGSLPPTAGKLRSLDDFLSQRPATATSTGKLLFATRDAFSGFP